MVETTKGLNILDIETKINRIIYASGGVTIM